ncbi:MAG: S8 family serine peptidase [Clostridia bacterium]|nr:S8 family serine peptidase [Clostridia bacterium]
MKHRIMALFAAGLLLLLAGALGAAAAEERRPETRYIVYTNDLRRGAAPSRTFSVVDADELARLQREGRVLFYEEDYAVELFDAMPYDEPHYAEKWDLQMVKVEAAWRQNCFGEGVRIAVIDSGIAEHPELGDRVTARVSYLENVDAAGDSVGHGTFVAGMIAAGADGAGIVGMAPQAELVSLKCFTQDHTTVVSEIVGAIYDAVDFYHCKILNMSFGVPKNTLTLQNAIDHAVESGCIVVAAVGNYGTTAYYYPAACAGVIGVGAVNADRAQSSFSQRNDSVWITAPGESVIGLYLDSGYAQASGTSFSAPLVSGAIALLLPFAPDADAAFFLDLFSRCSDDLGEAGYNPLYGYGLLNVERCLNSLLQLPGDLNGDGQITLPDVLYLLQGVLNKADTAALPRGDVSGDGRISLADVLRALKICAA